MARRIEIDEEVYSFLQKHARPFEDTPNSVLRRLLLGRSGQGSLAGVDEHTVPLPPDLPAAVRQVLEVVYLVKVTGLSRTEATAQVARRLNVAPQTVLDKYTRQLGMHASDFDRLLAGGLETVQSSLQERFKSHRDALETFFEGVREQMSGT